MKGEKNINKLSILLEFEFKSFFFLSCPKVKINLGLSINQEESSILKFGMIFIPEMRIKRDFKTRLFYKHFRNCNNIQYTWVFTSWILCSTTSTVSNLLSSSILIFGVIGEDFEECRIVFSWVHLCFCTKINCNIFDWSALNCMICFHQSTTVVYCFRLVFWHL